VEEIKNKLSQIKLGEIESYVKKMMNDGKIPGISIVIVEGDKTIYKRGYEYSRIKSRTNVSNLTLFELGSTSKAFTALAILKLEKEGAIKFDDSADKYIPWLKIKYMRKEEKISIKHLIEHTSGIRFESIDKIPATKSENALEETVKTLVGQELKFSPGKKFSYASINYDVLGLIIKNVTGRSFEEYIENEILKPLGLNNTYLFRENLTQEQMADGYKVGFKIPLLYEAPIYRGNTPAGYFITNIDDMERWIKIQLGVIEVPSVYAELIKKSHEANRNLPLNSDRSLYNYGWFIFEDGKIAQHGNNPNFSSSVVMRKNEKLGVMVLANMNSKYATDIPDGVVDILMDKAPKETYSDRNRKIDNICTAIIVGNIIVSFITLKFQLLGLIGRQRLRFHINGIMDFSAFISSLVLICLVVYCLCNIPRFYRRVSWKFAYIWTPITLFIAALLSGITTILLYIYFLFTYFGV